MSVRSIEHAKAWADEIRLSCGANALIDVRNRGDYVSAIVEKGGVWDVVVIDGVDRDECALSVAGRLAKGGLVVLDNSDWYPNACQTLRKAGLIQVDFHGFGPINGYPWTTSVFFDREFRILHKIDESFGPIRGIKGGEGESVTCEGLY